MKRKKRTISLRKFIHLALIFWIIIGSCAVITALLAVVFRFVIVNEKAMLISLFLTAGIFFVFVIYTFFMGNYLYLNVVKDMLSTTSKNMDKFIKLDTVYDKYQNTKITEFNVLNENLDEIHRLNSNTIVVNENFNYSNLGLEYVDDNKQVITCASLIKNVQQLISITPNFRNAFVELDFKINVITNAQKNFIIEQILDFYKDSKILIALNLTEKRFVIYNPNIDSISMIKENAEKLVKNCVIYEHVGKDEKLICPTVSIVVYPYSKIDDIFSDLNYARRKSQNLNLYLPRRLIKGNDKIFSNSMNINNISKILESFSDFSNIDSFDEIKDKFEYHFKRIASFYNFDFAGLVIYDDFFACYKPYLTVSQLMGTKLFDEDSVFSNKAVESLINVVDRDSSYFFSSRIKASQQINSYLDVINIESGFFSIVKFDNRVIAISYFLNRDKELFLDSYLRESLVVFARMVSDSLCILKNKEKARDYMDNNQSLLRLTNMKMYKINKIDYKLVSISDTLKDIFQKPYEGKKCYDYLYGLNSPCENCPLKSGSRRESFLDGVKHLSSLIIDNNNSSNVQIIMSPAEKGYISKKRFNTDFLINSYYSFTERLNNVFISQSKGYIIFVKINNYTEIIEKYGDEGYIKYARAFLQKVADVDNGISNTYAYRNNIFAIVVNECGQVDALEKCENIYDLSRFNYLNRNDSQDLFSLSFVTFRYPMNFASPFDLIKEFELFFKKDMSKVKDGYIYFAENGYTRSADKTEFMLDLLDQATSTRNLTVKLLPFVKNQNIIGAEMLLRLKDDSKNVLVNTNDLINVAIKNNRIGIITNILIDNIGDYYKSYGFSLFRMAGFRLISINTDNSYFADSKFFNSLENLVQQHSFQKNFLNLEVTEKELSEHYDEMMENIKRLSKLDICVICDMYTGEYLSLEKIKRLGIAQVKIARSVVNKIDYEESNYKELLSLINSCISHDVTPCIVGVEREQQANLILEKYPDILMQGYYFYEPLEADNLFDILRKVNIE